LTRSYLIAIEPRYHRELNPTRPDCY